MMMMIMPGARKTYCSSAMPLLDDPFLSYNRNAAESSLVVCAESDSSAGNLVEGVNGFCQCSHVRAH